MDTHAASGLRVAIIFDNLVRCDTTGTHCLHALRQIANVRHFLPAEIDRIPTDCFDLYLNIDDGLRYRLPQGLRPAAFWAIDTHMDFPWYEKKAPDFDWVFCAQRDGAKELADRGVNAEWLPLACDPNVHCAHQIPKSIDVCFVGRLAQGPRLELVETLIRAFPNTFVGERYLDEMVRTVSMSRIAFNRSIKNDVNMRMFEALSCGTMLLTNDLLDNGQSDLFQDGVHLATYRDADELVDKAKYYLGHESIRETIAKNGQREVRVKHTYLHRMERILNCLPSSAKSSVVVSGTQTYEPTRDSHYFDCPRPELQALVPETAQRLLDIGCGAGRFGESLKAKYGLEVVGVEVDPAAAAKAKVRLDHVLVGDVESEAIDLPADSFDVITAGDVLEHLRDPLHVLRRAHKWLRPNGRFIASIPNVQNQQVLRSLLAGNWTYQPAGLLDRDHLRFFTRREIEKLFFRAGYELQQIRPLPNVRDDKKTNENSSMVQFGRLCINGLNLRQAEDFDAYQYLVEAVPAHRREHGVTSIIVVTYNELPYTLRCLDSIRQFSDERL